MASKLTGVLLVSILTLVAAHTLSAASATMNKQQAYQLLRQGDSAAVRALPPGEREILMAKLALDGGKTDEAIRILGSKSLARNPLAALIRAEAYRRQSVDAARRAGHYAHAVTGNIGKLEKARIGGGLDQAEKQLQAFMGGKVAPSVKVATTVKQPSAGTIVAAQPETFRHAIESWRRDWESRDADAYLSHYHTDFRTDKHNLKSWSAYKRRINGHKSYIKVQVSDLKLLRGPERIAQGEAVLVGFRQKYQSSNYAANSRKQLYMVRNQKGGAWKILFEGDAASRYRPQASTTGKQTPARISRNASIPSGVWAINLGAFDSAAGAKKMASGIHLKGAQQPFIASVNVAGKLVHRVQIGMYRDRRRAVDAMVSICPKLELSGCWLEQSKR